MVFIVTNQVFHWTDVPSLVSGDYLVMFDPHAKYVPGATDVARGIKIRFFFNKEILVIFRLFAKWQECIIRQTKRLDFFK